MDSERKVDRKREWEKIYRGGWHVSSNRKIDIKKEWEEIYR